MNLSKSVKLLGYKYVKIQIKKNVNHKNLLKEFDKS